MTKKNRLVAIILALTVFFVMLSSVCFIVAQADHDCVGEDCPICYQISTSENTLKNLGNVAVIVAFAALLTYSVVNLSAYAEKHSINTTLVSLKIKLSD